VHGKETVLDGGIRRGTEGRDGGPSKGKVDASFRRKIDASCQSSGEKCSEEGKITFCEDLGESEDACMKEGG